MRTCPAPGLGISRSTISKSPPALEICAAFIGATPTFVVAMMPPDESRPYRLKHLLTVRRDPWSLRLFFALLVRAPSRPERETKCGGYPRLRPGSAQDRDSFLKSFDARPIESVLRGHRGLAEARQWDEGIRIYLVLGDGHC